jgi:site-specific recombinase XerD
VSSVLQFKPIDDQQAQRAQLDQLVSAWLAVKEGKSFSPHTARVYQATLGSFRTHLRGLGADLDSAQGLIVAQVQVWAALGQPSPATYNQRCAVVSSFYRYCAQHDLLPDHCPANLDRADRRKVQEYGSAQALTPEEARALLASIDLTTPAGLRDYALLRLALSTGRRLAEVAGLRWRDLRLRGDQVRVTFRRCKGGKQMVDTLSAGASAALLAWLHHYYGRTLARLPADAPIWPSLSHNDTGGQALSVVALQRLCEQRMGVTFHALRHTFARSLEDHGAKVSDIQRRLGHESLQTTGKYLAALKRDDNPHAELLDQLFGDDGKEP